MYRLKKSLGQHFLKDENICRKMIGILKKYPVDQLLEVGPGGGALTKYLLQMDHTELVAVELDHEKVEFLMKTYPALEDKIIEGSVLEIEKPFEGKFAVVGNFPYNISSQILFRVLEWKENIAYMMGMFQKEVAQRVAAPEGNKTYGVLSVLVQAFFRVDYLFEVHERCFVPPPKVKSAVIFLSPRVEPLPMKNQTSFFLLVKTAFNQRRKTLRNAAKALFEEAILAESVFNKRAEQLSVDDFAQLTFNMK